MSGKLVSHHDLRRTWATAARKLKLDERNIDYCLKHKRSDVNEHYFVRNEAEILETMQTVEDFFLAVVAETLKAPVAQNFLDKQAFERQRKNNQNNNQNIEAVA